MNTSDIIFCIDVFIATMEIIKEHCRILLHVENYGSVCAAETSQSRGGRVEIETSLHS